MEDDNYAIILNNDPHRPLLVVAPVAQEDVDSVLAETKPAYYFQSVIQCMTPEEYRQR